MAAAFRRVASAMRRDVWIAGALVAAATAL
jgi:hypothetical protein